MEYKKIDMRSYNLHMIKTTDFKRVFVKVFFRRPITKKDVTYRNMLSDILLDSNIKFRDNRSLAIEAENNYNLSVSSTNTRWGNYIVSSYNLVALNEKYAEEGSFDKALEFFFDVLFSPNVENNSFDKRSFNIVKNTLESEIKSLKDNKSKYSIVRMLEIMDDESPISYRGCGYLEDISNITQENLYDYYQDMINNDLVDVYVLGDIDYKKIENYFRNNFKVKSLKKENKELICTFNKLRSTPKKVIEFDNITQSKLSIGCKLKDLTEFESKYVMPIYNMILGGDSDSKFFRDIREKKSLCYYVNSSYNRIDNLMTITSGINQSNLNEMISSINQSIKEMTKGKFSEEDIEIAKCNIISSIDSIKDSPIKIINTYYSSLITGLDEIEVRRQQYKKVTKEDIINLSKKIKLDTIYLLSGGDNGKN